MPGIKQRIARKSAYISGLTNTLLSVLQIFIGFVAQSSALIADGLHSLSDLLADLVILLVNRYSHKAADDDHPYGHWRFETAASFFLGFLLLLVGFGMFWNVLNKLSTPSLLTSVHPSALGVAILVLIVKECLFRYLLTAAKCAQSSMLIANAWHARSDAASSFVVAVGVSGNLLGIPLFDPLAAGIVGFLVCRMGIKFSYEAFQDLMDRGLNEAEVERLSHTLATTEGVINAHDIRTRKMGDVTLVDAHLLVDGHISVSEGHQIALCAQQRLRQQYAIYDVTIHIDADREEGLINLKLPSRQHLLQQLNQRLDHHVLQLDQLLAHYLDGYIELDILLPASPQSSQIAVQLQARPAIEHVSRLRVFIEKTEGEKGPLP